MIYESEVLLLLSTIEKAHDLRFFVVVGSTNIYVDGGSRIYGDLSKSKWKTLSQRTDCGRVPLF